MIVLIALLFGSVATSWAQELPYYPDVAIVIRDYAGNIQTTDRTWYYTDDDGSELEEGGGIHPSVEYDMSENRRPGPNVTGVAYIRGEDTIDLTLTIYGELSEGVDCDFTMVAARLKIPAINQSSEDWEYSSLTPSPTTEQSWHWNAGNRTKVLNFTFTGLPNHVALGQLEVKFNFYLVGEETMTLCDNGTRGGYTGWEWQYVVFSAPHGLQEVPWTDFLNYTCRWAYGAATAANTAKELTRGMHYSNRSKSHRVFYNLGGDSNYYPIVPEETSFQFELSEFVGNLDSSLWTELDCRDFAGGLSLSLQSQGLEPRFDIVQRWNGESVPGNFWTWPLCPAGTDSTISGNRADDLGNYESQSFSYHCVITYNNQRFDASSSYLWQPSGAVWENPAWEWGITDYWQKNVSSMFYGLAYGTVKSEDPFESGSELQHITVLDYDPLSIL